MPRISGTVPGLEPETEYEFQVRVVDRFGNAGDWSNVARGTTLAAAGTILSIIYDNGEKIGSPKTATRILSATKMVGETETAFTLPEDQVGQRLYYPGNPDPGESWFTHAILSQGGYDVLEWGGFRDQWVAAESTLYSSYGEETVILRLNNIAAVAGTENFKVVVECRFAVTGSDLNPGTSRILAEVKDGTATYADKYAEDYDYQNEPQLSFTMTGSVLDSDELTGLTVEGVSGSGSNGDMPGSWAAVTALVTYDRLNGTTTITVAAP